MFPLQLSRSVFRSVKNRIQPLPNTLEEWKRPNTSLVEKLNRTPGATPRSLPRNPLPLLTYEQIKKLPASRKPSLLSSSSSSSRTCLGSPLARENDIPTEHGIQRDIIFRPAPPNPLPATPVLITDELYVIKPPPPDSMLP